MQAGKVLSKLAYVGKFNAEVIESNELTLTPSTIQELKHKIHDLGMQRLLDVKAFSNPITHDQILHRQTQLRETPKRRVLAADLV